jgi:hypothetical protein
MTGGKSDGSPAIAARLSADLRELGFAIREQDCGIE